MDTTIKLNNGTIAIAIRNTEMSSEDILNIFTTEQLTNFFDKAKKFNCVHEDVLVTKYCPQYDLEDGSIMPPHICYSTGTGRYDHTECLYGKANVEDPNLLHGRFWNEDDEDIVVDCSTREKEELYNSLDDNDIIGWCTGSDNSLYPTYKWEVTTIIKPDGRRYTNKETLLRNTARELEVIEERRQTELNECDNSERGELMQDGIERDYRTNVIIWLSRAVSKGFTEEEILERFPEVEDVLF